MAFQLSVVIFGAGVFDRAHWGFVIHRPPNRFGDLLHVRVIDIPSNRFIFENRTGQSLDSQNAWGLCKIAFLDSVERFRATSILTCEKPPIGGTKDCQDWLVDAMISLETEELVPAGTAETWASRVGRPTVEVRSDAGADWEPLNGT